jgi:hypothetical protein
MSSTRSVLVITAAAFAGGFMAGVLYQTPSARQFRGSLATSARTQAHWLEQRLEVLENQIRQLEGQLQQAGSDLGQRLRGAVARPQEEPERWDVDVDTREVERELPRIPRS